MADSEYRKRKILDLRTVILGFGAWVGTVTAPVASDLLRQVVSENIDQLPIYFGVVVGVGLAVLGYLLWRSILRTTRSHHHIPEPPEEESESDSAFDRYMSPNLKEDPPVRDAPRGSVRSGRQSIRFLKLLAISVGFGYVMGIAFLEILAYTGIVTS